MGAPVMISISGLFGLLYAALEHWPINDAIEYALNSTVAQGPFESQMMKTEAGKGLDVAFRLTHTALNSMFLGGVASMALIQRLGRGANRSCWSLLRFCMFYIP